jgi:hypothetical protein
MAPGAEKPGPGRPPTHPFQTSDVRNQKSEERKKEPPFWLLISDF